MKRLTGLAVFLAALLLVPALAQAQYFGQNGDGTGHGVRAAHYLKACRFENTAATGTLAELDLNLYAAAAGHVRLAVYADNGSDTSTGYLLLDAGEITNPAAGWNSIKGLALPVVKGTRYWLAWENDVAVDVYQDGASSFAYQYFAYAPFPAQIAVGSLQAGRTSIRALVVSAAPAARIPLAPGFAMRPFEPRVGRPVQFTDYSTGAIVSWLWDFGDGTTSTEQNPVHAYTVAGEFTVSLTISDGTESVTLTMPGYRP